jgi:hypothetical protein
MLESYKIQTHIGDWGLGMGIGGLANPQSPIPNPHPLII